LLYGMLGGVWILFTDRLLYSLVSDAEAIASWQTAKGWLFVAASAAFVFLLSLRAAKREKAARESEGDLLVITDSLPGPVSRVDSHGRYLFANAAYTEWFGLTPSQVIGRTQRDVLGEELYGRIAPHVRRALDGTRVQYKAPTHSPDGKVRWGLVTLIPDFGEAGDVEGHFTVVLDVTEREEERLARAETEERYRRLVEGAADAILVYQDNRVTLVNEAAVRLYGADSRDELIGRDWHDFVDTPDHYVVGEQLEGLRQGEELTEPLQLSICRLDGGRVPVEVSASRFQDGDDVSLHIIVRDISARKEAETALLELNRELEERVAARTEDLEIARERAEAADQLKSLFLASMSHELRTPLNSIIGFTGVLLQELPGPVNEEQRKQLEIVQRASRHLLALINDVLDISKIEADELRLESRDYDLAAVVMEAAEMVQPKAHEKKLGFRLEISEGLEHAVGDAHRLRQVLTNLLGNAVKFTHTGEVTVTAGIELETSPLPDTEGGVARIDVGDTGIGISADDQAEIFHPFSQIGTEENPAVEGTGLGLAISRRLARLMGGEILVHSEPGKGSTFTLYLPLRPSQ